MAIVRKWENAAIVTPLCPFDMYRSNRGDTALDGVPQCMLCVRPYEGCNTVDKQRTFTIFVAGTFTFNDIQNPSDETWLEAQLVNKTLAWEDISGCHWTAEINGSQGGNTILNIDFDLTVTDDSPGIVDLSLDVVIGAGTELNGHGPGVPTTVTYTLDDQDPWATGDLVLTTVASEAARTIEFDNGPPPEQMILPTTFTLRVDQE